MKSVISRFVGTVAAAGLVGGGIVAGVAIGQQAGSQPVPAQQPRPAAQTVDVVPQPVEQGTTLKAKPQPKPDTSSSTTTVVSDASTVDSSTTTSSTSTAPSTSTPSTSTPTQEAPVTTSPDPTPAPAPQTPPTLAPDPTPQGPHNQDGTTPPPAPVVPQPSN